MGRRLGQLGVLASAFLAPLGAAGLASAQLANDDREGALPIRPGQAVTSSLALATPSADPLPSAESCPFLGWAAPRRDVWYRFDPPQPDGFLTLDLCASDFDTSVVLYRLDTATGAIEQIGCDDDDCNPTGPTYQSRISELRLSGDARPVLARIAGWSNQVGTLRMRADWTPAAKMPVRFTSGGLFHDARVSVAGEQSSSRGPGAVGPSYAFVEGNASLGVARAGGLIAAQVISGWSPVTEIRIEGELEASHPSGSGTTSEVRCIAGTATGESAPLEITLEQERYFRLTSLGSVRPFIVAGTGCVCGTRLAAGTYLVDLDFAVLLQGGDAADRQNVDWRLELSPTPFAAADIDGDGVVDGTDLGLLLVAWGGQGEADLNGDGTVDADDLGTLLAGWGS